ncbi:hypothetical protein V8D89_011522 [Ganoderma adspersum]
MAAIWVTSSPVYIANKHPNPLNLKYRDDAGKKPPTVKEYLDGIDPTKITTGLWIPTKQWNRLHGDKKSTTGGTYHMETIHGSDGVYKAKVVGPGGTTSLEVQWPAATKPAPDPAVVIAALKAKA